jgi:hypothetical protein
VPKSRLYVSNLESEHRETAFSTNRGLFGRQYGGVLVSCFAVDTNSGALRWISDPLYVRIRELAPDRRLTKKAAPLIMDTEERKDFVSLRYCVNIMMNTKHTNAFQHRAPNMPHISPASRPLYKGFHYQDTKDGLLVVLVHADIVSSLGVPRGVRLPHASCPSGLETGVRLISGMATQATVKCVFGDLTMGSMSTPYDMPRS